MSNAAGDEVAAVPPPCTIAQAEQHPQQDEHRGQRVRVYARRLCQKERGVGKARETRETYETVMLLPLHRVRLKLPRCPCKAGDTSTIRQESASP